MDRRVNNRDSGSKQVEQQECPHMTVHDLAEYLNITESTIYKMVNRGEIPVVRLGTNRRTLRFNRECIRQWLTTRQTQSVPTDSDQ